jgi:hypothetical protein
LKPLESTCQSSRQRIGTNRHGDGKTGEEDETSERVPPWLARMTDDQPSTVGEAKQHGRTTSLSMGPATPGTPGSRRRQFFSHFGEKRTVRPTNVDVGREVFPKSLQCSLKLVMGALRSWKNVSHQGPHTIEP